MAKNFPRNVGALLGCCLIASATYSANAETIEYSNYDSPLFSWGSSKAEKYDVGVRLSGTDFGGLEISSISFPIVSDPEISGYSIWLTEELSLTDGVNTPDITSVEVIPDNGIITLNFDEPVVINESGMYAGYSFTVAKRETEEQKKPIKIVTRGKDTAGHGLYVHSSRTYGKWTDGILDKDSFLPFSMTLTGVEKYAAQMTMPEKLNAGAGKEIDVEITLTNKGASSVNSIEIEYTLSGGTANSVQVELPEPLAKKFLATTPLKVSLPADEELGHQTIEARVSAVNGFKNENLSSPAKADIDFWSFVPVHRPLFEEYTGIGCGYCPRGGVGLDKLSEIFKEDFVGVAYHSTDVMSIMNPEDFANPAPAIPTAWVDRTRETDPYFGDRMEDNVFAADEVWKEMASRFTPADISLSLNWTDEEKTAIEAVSSMTFVKEVADMDLRMIYILVADGLKGNDPRWFQGNTYSGETGKWPSDLDVFVYAPNPIVDIVFDHVAVMTTSPDDENASLPANIGQDESLSHSATLNLSDAVNLTGESLIQDKGKLSVVAIIFDAAKGEVMNCVKAVPGNSGISGITEEGKEPVSKIYFNSCGIRVDKPLAGELYVETSVYADGSRSSKKVIYNN